MHELPALAKCINMNSGKIKRNSFCRLCLKKHNHLMDIFEDSDDDQNDISKYINLFFAVEIARGDHFSTHVCKPCWDIIVSTCKYRIEYRNNDLLLRNCDNETPLPIKLQEPVRKRHKSVENILQKYSGIILDPDLWNLNFNPAVNLSKSRVPSNSPYLLQLHSMSEIFKEPSPKISGYEEDPDFELSEKSYNYRSKYKRNYTESESDEEGSKLSDSEMTGRNRRNSRRPRIFGSPLYIPDNEFEDVTLDYYGM